MVNPVSEHFHHMQPTVRAVVFDRDQTLVTFDPIALRLIEQQIAQIAPPLPSGATTIHWSNWSGPWPRTVAEEPAFWVLFWSALAREHGLDDSMQTALIEVGAMYHRCFRAFDDSYACVQALRQRDLRLAVLTNFELPSIDRTLAHAGLDPTAFDVLLSSAMVGASKPHLAAFQAVLDALDVPASACAFVDDLPENVIGAAEVGMYPILLDRANHHPDWVGTRITTLAVLPDLLNKW
jgi:FMN phosphatase YigB (HAD superfamily)